MRLLLDTQIFLWFLTDATRMPREARAAIEVPTNAVFISAATLWEIAVKASSGRLAMVSSDIARLPDLVERAGFDELPVLGRHAAGVYGLPMHHRDPFDRLLISQALAEALTIVTVDAAIRRYDVSVF